MPGPTKPALRLMFDEARHVLEVQTEAIKTLDQKAATLLRFNVLLLGVFATGASLVARMETPQTDPTLLTAGFLATLSLLLVSTVYTIIAYRSIRTVYGVQAESLRGALEHEADEEAVLRASLHAYTRALRRNSPVAHRATTWLDRAIFTLIAGLVLLCTTAIGLWVMNLQ